MNTNVIACKNPMHFMSQFANDWMIKIMQDLYPSIVVTKRSILMRITFAVVVLHQMYLETLLNYIVR